MTSKSEMLARIDSLPSLPAVVARLSSLLDDQTKGASDFEAVVMPDPALTTNLLRMINSPLFGLGKQVTSVRQAITYLGINKVFEIASSASFARVIPAVIPGYNITAESFWAHCVAVAVLSENLAKEINIKSRDMIFLSGLLHDIGKLVVGVFIDDAHESIIERMKNTSEPFIATEKAVIGSDHCEIGYEASKKWNLPDAVAISSMYHHNPDLLVLETDDNKSSQQTIDLVHVADSLAHMLGFGTDIGELHRKVQNNSLQRLGIKVADLEIVAGESMEQIKSMSSIINS